MEFVCSVWISEQTANLQRAVRTESLYNTDTFRLLKVNPAISCLMSYKATIFILKNSTFLIRNYVF
jgi:hypothetical protein